MATTAYQQQLDAIDEIADEDVQYARREGFFADWELRRARHCEGLLELALDKRWASAWEGMEDHRVQWAFGWAEHARDCRTRAAGHMKHLERDAYVEDEIESLLR